MSDHKCQLVHANVLDRSRQTVSKKPKFYFKRCYSEENIETFRDHLATYDWDTILLAQDTVDVWYDEFIKRIIYSHEIAFSVKKLKLKNVIKGREWITSGIRKSKDTYEFLAQLSKISTDPGTKTYFKRYKAVYKKVIRKSKQMCNAVKLITQSTKEKKSGK